MLCINEIDNKVLFNQTNMNVYTNGIVLLIVSSIMTWGRVIYHRNKKQS